MTKGMIHGGVDLSHKGPKMSGKAKSLESYPGGMPGPGEYGSMNNKVVGKGMMKYMAGEPVGMAKYKTNDQRKAAHASMAEQGAGKYGKHMGPEKAKTMVKGPDGKMVPDYAVDGKGRGDLKKSSPGKHGHKKGPKKADFDKDMAEERIQIKDDKEKIFEDDKEKRKSEGMKKYGHKKGPSKTKIALDNVTVTGNAKNVGANDAKVLKHLKRSGRSASNIKEALKKYGKNRVYQSAKSSGGDYSLFQGVHGKQ